MSDDEPINVEVSVLEARDENGGYIEDGDQTKSKSIKLRFHADDDSKGSAEKVFSSPIYECSLDDGSYEKLPLPGQTNHSGAEYDDLSLGKHTLKVRAKLKGADGNVLKTNSNEAEFTWTRINGADKLE